MVCCLNPWEGDGHFEQPEGDLHLEDYTTEKSSHAAGSLHHIGQFL